MVVYPWSATRWAARRRMSGRPHKVARITKILTEYRNQSCRLRLIQALRVKSGTRGLEINCNAEKRVLQTALPEAKRDRDDEHRARDGYRSQTSPPEA